MHPVKLLKSFKVGRACVSDRHFKALNFHFDCLVIPVTRPLFMRKQNVFVLYIYATEKGGNHICSNKHETGLTDDILIDLS